jgi:hypothetical protein
MVTKSECNQIYLPVIFFTALPPLKIHPPISCPNQIEPLANLLVRDLPSYANRAALKNRKRSDVSEMSQVIIASEPNLEPLDLPGKTQKPDPNLHQLFITTLERQTFQKKTSEFQQYHWLFLVQTRQGWKLSQSFTRISSYPLSNKLTATRESSQGTIAQAVKVWLRDCQAGVIRPTL